METLEQKVDYEKEGLKAHFVKPLLLQSVYQTPEKEKEYSDSNIKKLINLALVNSVRDSNDIISEFFEARNFCISLSRIK